MNEKIIISTKVVHTLNTAKQFSHLLHPGDIIGLIGDLGSGKTIFVKGIAQGLGIEEPVTSPTFSILQIYTGKYKLYHFDLYRLNSKSELMEIGYEEYFFAKGIVVIEWAEKFLDFLPKNSYLIYMKYMDQKKREIKITQI